ncbi:MAG TPA: aspartate kinase [Polyangiaceae bacterium]|nr:aspartate kinase [Polyangiaceae bacterium]
MAIVVQKYGGSSVADSDKIALVARHIAATRSAGHQVVVVVSAMGKATENLLSLARSIASDPPRRELDMLVSTGERVTMALMSMALSTLGCDAVSFTGSQSGIITNDRHFDAQIIEVRPHRIEDELARGRVVIVAGYQGMSYRREITTLGRGGSDTTAVALAAALGAEHCEIYSDVDGIYSADPRNVADARHLPAIDYETMQEIAESGAKVLNARAVEWARRHRILIHARKTADHAENGAGNETRIEAEARALGAVIVVDEKLAWVQAPSALSEALFAVIAKNQIPIRDAWIERDACLLLSLTSVPEFERTRQALLAIGADQVRTDVACVSAIAVGVGGDAARLRQIFEVVPSSALARMVSTLRVSSVLPKSDAGALERAWHALLA